MTRGEFMGQFTRLCVGFTYGMTAEQAEAWFRRIGHAHVGDWSEAITTMLCGRYFPKLDEAMAAIEAAQRHRRKTEIEREKPGAKRLAHLISGEGQILGNPLSPALVQSIKAVSAREQTRRYLRRQADGAAYLSPALSTDALLREEERLTNELTKLLPQLDEHELGQFMDHHAASVTA